MKNQNKYIRTWRDLNHVDQPTQQPIEIEKIRCAGGDLVIQQALILAGKRKFKERKNDD